MVASLPAVKLDMLYANPFICEAILRFLSIFLLYLKLSFSFNFDIMRVFKPRGRILMHKYSGTCLVIIVTLEKLLIYRIVFNWYYTSIQAASHDFADSSRIMKLKTQIIVGRYWAIVAPCWANCKFKRRIMLWCSRFIKDIDLQINSKIYQQLITNGKLLIVLAFSLDELSNHVELQMMFITKSQLEKAFLLSPTRLDCVHSDFSEIL